MVRCLGEKAKDVSGGYLTKSRELAVKTLCIFVLAFAVLYVSTPEAQFSLDGARDEAVASGAIVDWQRGVHASIEGLHHGALWFRYLRATRAAGFDVQGQYLLVTILCAAAVHVESVFGSSVFSAAVLHHRPGDPGGVVARSRLLRRISGPLGGTTNR